MFRPVTMYSNSISVKTWGWSVVLLSTCTLISKPVKSTFFLRMIEMTSIAEQPHVPIATSSVGRNPSSLPPLASPESICTVWGEWAWPTRVIPPCQITFASILSPLLPAEPAGHLFLSGAGTCIRFSTTLTNQVQQAIVVHFVRTAIRAGLPILQRWRFVRLPHQVPVAQPDPYRPGLACRSIFHIVTISLIG